MSTLHVRSLKCYETEDYTGADECRLEIYVNGQKTVLRHSLNDNQTWQIDRQFEFTDEVKIKLYDEDSPDADDHLGTITIGKDNVQIKLWDEDFGWGDGDDLLGEVLINSSLGENKTAKFNLDDSDYTLAYTVCETTLALQDDVNQLLDEFRYSNITGVWPKIDKNQLIEDIRAIVANPLRVNQGRAPLCGPASVVYELVKKEPARYIRICRELYEKGSFPTRSKTYSASSNLSNSKLRIGITPANWILMTTIIEHVNLILNFDADSWDLAYGSHELFMKEWVKEILLYDRVDWTPTYTYGEFDALRQAKRAYDSGGVAFFTIHSALVGNPPPLVALAGNHWVAYAGNLYIDEGKWYVWDSGHVKFDCYTWGEIRTVDTDEGTFEDYFFGVVTGER